MSVGAKAAGFAAMGRVILYAFGQLSGDWIWVLAVLSALTMTVGNLAALRQVNLKRMLAYSSIAHAGYILAGMASASETGTSSVLFYLFAYAFMNVGAFAILIATSRFHGEGTGETLPDLAGLGTRKPGLAVAMTLFMLSLAGVPPLAGFLAKLYVFGAAVQAGLTWLAAVGVINSVASAYYYLRVVVYMTMREGEPGDEAQVCPALQVGLGIATFAVVIVGLWSAPILDLARQAAAALVGS
jgi:NADH-quinone oxidoreductase subunit N